MRKSERVRGFACACLLLSSTASGIASAQVKLGAPETIAHLKGVRESSGVVASRQNSGIFWTHNDSGGGPYLYAFDLKGRSYGRWRVPGARTLDWEDISIGPGTAAGSWYIYVGDIGDNEQKRRDVAVYRIEEPKVAEPSACQKGCNTAPAVTFRLRYPDRPHNAETLMIHPKTADLYVVSKAGGGDRETTVYVARARQLVPRGTVRLTAIATLDVPDMLFRRLAGGITGGDIDPDGRRVVLCDYFRMYYAEIPRGAKFDEIWKQPFTGGNIGFGLQTEGICFTADGKAVIATSEANSCPIIRIGIEDSP